MKWYNKNCFSGGHGVCWFDKYSFLHFGNLGFIYAIFLLIGLIKNIKLKWSIYLFLIINAKVFFLYVIFSIIKQLVLILIINNCFCYSKYEI